MASFETNHITPENTDAKKEEATPEKNPTQAQKMFDKIKQLVSAKEKTSLDADHKEADDMLKKLEEGGGESMAVDSGLGEIPTDDGEGENGNANLDQGTAETAPSLNGFIGPIEDGPKNEIGNGNSMPMDNGTDVQINPIADDASIGNENNQGM